MVERPDKIELEYAGPERVAVPMLWWRLCICSAFLLVCGWSMYRVEVTYISRVSPDQPSIWARQIEVLCTFLGCVCALSAVCTSRSGPRHLATLLALACAISTLMLGVFIKMEYWIR